jgi:hypothetical protein
MFHHVVIVKHHLILIIHQNFVLIVIKYPIVMSKLFISLNIFYYFYLINRTCQKLHATEHKNYCGFRLSDNYEVIGIPFIISLPESKLTCENVFEQIRIYAK